MGNGEHLAETPLVYSYETPGMYPVILTATDLCGITRISEPTMLPVGDRCDPSSVAPCCGDGTCGFGEGLYCSADCPGPPAGLAVRIGPYYEGVVNQPVVFKAAIGTNPGEEVFSYLWHFGDGATSAEATPSHAYASEGTFQAKLSVQTSFGFSASATARVDITGSGVSTQCSECSFTFALVYDHANDRVVPTGTAQYPEEYKVAVGVDIYDPAGHHAAHLSMELPPGISHYQIPVSLYPQLYNPTPGLWYAQAIYFVRSLVSGLPFTPVAFLTRSTYVPQRSLAIQGPEAMEDGASATYSASLPDGSSPTDIVWTAEPRPDAIASSGILAPGVALSPPDETPTEVQLAWYVTADQAGNTCPTETDQKHQAMEMARYRLAATVGASEGGGQSQQDIASTVPAMAVWGHVAGSATRPVDYRFRMAWFPEIGRYKVTSNTVSRSPSDITNLVHPNGKFFNKVQVHEEKHADNWVSPTGLYSDFFHTSNYLSYPEDITGLVVSEFVEQDRNRLADRVADHWAAFQRFERLRMEPLDEIDQAQAFDASDQVPPFYLFHNCGRFEQ
jgi:PKD repeat protein